MTNHQEIDKSQDASPASSHENIPPPAGELPATEKVVSDAECQSDEDFDEDFDDDLDDDFDEGLDEDFDEGLDEDDARIKNISLTRQKPAF